MSYELRLLSALQDAQALALKGGDTAYCLERAAIRHAVDRGDLAGRWLAKLIERDRARAALAQLKDGDDVGGY
jgi:hypothetical protein